MRSLAPGKAPDFALRDFLLLPVIAQSLVSVFYFLAQLGYCFCVQFYKDLLSKSGHKKYKGIIGILTLYREFGSCFANCTVLPKSFPAGL